MLVLSRKPGEGIVIGENIQLTVVTVRGGYVRLGFTAPADVLIRREELCPRPAHATFNSGSEMRRPTEE
jgi:carbon storage regulator